MARHRISFWEEISTMYTKYPTLFIEGHYSIIKELMYAIMAADGFSSANHECALAYMAEKHGNLDIDLNFLFELKDLRNAISYEGMMLGERTWLRNREKIKQTVNTLIRYAELMTRDAA